MSPDTDSAVGQLSRRVDDLGTDVRDLRGAIDRLTEGVISMQKLDSRVTNLEAERDERKQRRFQLRIAYVSPIVGSVLGAAGVVLVAHI